MEEVEKRSVEESTSRALKSIIGRARKVKGKKN